MQVSAWSVSFLINSFIHWNRRQQSYSNCDSFPTKRQCDWHVSNHATLADFQWLKIFISHREDHWHLLGWTLLRSESVSSRSLLRKELRVALPVEYRFLFTPVFTDTSESSGNPCTFQCTLWCCYRVDDNLFIWRAADDTHCSKFTSIL